MQAARRYFGPSFGRHTLTSVAATAADFVVASALHGLGIAAAAPATFLGCVAGGILAFALGRHYSFRAGGGRALPQLARFLFVWATSALLNSAGVPALLGFVGSFSLAWLLVRGAVYLGWNYPLSRWFVFAPRRGGAELSAP